MKLNLYILEGANSPPLLETKTPLCSWLQKTEGPVTSREARNRTQNTGKDKLDHKNVSFSERLPKGATSNVQAGEADL